MGDKWHGEVWVHHREALDPPLVNANAEDAGETPAPVPLIKQQALAEKDKEIEYLQECRKAAAAMEAQRALEYQQLMGQARRPAY